MAEDPMLIQVHPAFLIAKTAVARLKALNDKAMSEAASELKNRADQAVMRANG